MQSEPVIACVDVDYRAGGAAAAGVWFRGWTATAVEFQAVRAFADAAEYEPGAFYRRELPCLLGVLERGPRADAIVVDGYVWLGDNKLGLGAHLHEITGGVVVGVAKTRYASANAVPVYRGNSRSPLFVTAAGADPQTAAAWIAAMAGPYRLPTMLKLVDTLARGATFAEDSSRIDS